MFIVLLSKIVSWTNHQKILLLSNEKCMTEPTLFNLPAN